MRRHCYTDRNEVLQTRRYRRHKLNSHARRPMPTFLEGVSFILSNTRENNSRATRRIEGISSWGVRKRERGEHLLTLTPQNCQQPSSVTCAPAAFSTNRPRKLPPADKPRTPQCTWAGLGAPEVAVSAQTVLVDEATVEDAKAKADGGPVVTGRRRGSII